ncbi:MAG: hypothetical protein AAB320_00050 [Elusimicrobiota bacterium]
MNDQPAGGGSAGRALAKLRRPTKAGVSAVGAAHGIRSFLRLGELASERGARAAATLCFELASGETGSSVFARLEQMRANALLSRFDEAFAIGEALLDSGPSTVTLENLANRLSSGDGRRSVDLAVVRRLERYAARNPRSPWPVGLLVDALHKLNRNDEALRRSKKLAAFPKRYWWMRYEPGWLWLTERADYAAAKKEFRAVTKVWPSMWYAGAHLAELELCLGRERECFRLFDKVVAPLKGFDRAQAVAWRGEMKLWIGRYADALCDLQEGADGGAAFALGWLGGAKLLLGRADEAASDLERHLGVQSDREASVWLGEALRRLGRHKEALALLDRSIDECDEDYWALINRALVRLALGDEAGARSDYDDIPARIRDFMGRGVPLAASLERGLASGRGVRRIDGYLEPIWMARRR